VIGWCGVFPWWVRDYIWSLNSSVHGSYCEIRSWDIGVTGQKYLFKPRISDIVSPCPCKRDVWLRRVRHVRIDGPVLAVGWVMHRVFYGGFRVVLG